MVDVDRETLETQGGQDIVDNERGFDVGSVGVGADGVEITLVEFTVAAVLRVLAAPNRADVVAFEGCAELADVLCGKAGEGHR